MQGRERQVELLLVLEGVESLGQEAQEPREVAGRDDDVGRFVGIFPL